MKSSTAALLFCLFAAAPVQAAKENPLGEVISLLTSLAAKITKDGEAEAKAYKEYFEWCDDASKQKGFELKTASATKESLEATIAKEAGIVSSATLKIEELAASIAADEDEVKKATEVRAKEAADFKSEEAELVDVIGTLERAIAIVEKEMSKNPAAFAQVDASSGLDRLLQSLSTVVEAAAFSSDDRRKLVALVQAQQGDDDENAGAPAAAVYKTHSTGVVEVLDDLKEKAEEQLATLQKSEGSAAHNFEMLKQSLDDQIGADSKSLAEEKAAMAAATEAKATAEGDLAETEKVLADGKSALDTIHSDCMQTAADHEATVTARTEELGVIAKAKSILESTTAGAVEDTYSLIQKKASSRFQSRHSDEVVTMVARLAKQQHSAALTQLASRISAELEFGASAGEDPFTKVKGLISELITKLENEAAAAASEKAWCDEQLAKTTAKKGELDYDIEKLSTKIDSAEATSAGLKEDVKALQAELAALAKLQAEMDTQRAESHADYVSAKEDLSAGLSGVRGALGVLRDYYGSSAAAGAAMMQMAGADAQPSVPEAHVKATGAGTSIIGILEVVESDFATNLATEEKEEADAASEYEKTTQSNSVTKTLKDQDVKYKTAEYKALDKTVTELKADRESKDAELSAVTEYLGQVQERCTAKAETYEERKAKREAEIAGLKEALEVLESETALVQQRKGRSRRGGFLSAGDQ